MFPKGNDVCTLIPLDLMSGCLLNEMISGNSMAVPEIKASDDQARFLPLQRIREISKDGGGFAYLEKSFKLGVLTTTGRR